MSKVSVLRAKIVPLLNRINDRNITVAVNKLLVKAEYLEQKEIGSNSDTVIILPSRDNDPISDKTKLKLLLEQLDNGHIPADFKSELNTVMGMLET